MRTHDRHILMCTGSRCTENGQHAEALFKVLGQRLDAEPDLRVKRTRSHCFAVCKNGPVMVVYPDGVWYHQLNADTIQRVVTEHLIGETPVASHVFHRLGEGDLPTEPTP